MNPDFTIVTPSFNYGRYIGDCLQSVAIQEGVEVEHLVMDAGSNDITKEVVDGFPHASFHQEPDKGMSDGINKGFRRAQGKWMMWLNADDRLKPGALKEVKKFAEAHPHADVIYGGWDFISGDGTLQKRTIPPPFDLGMMIHYGCYIGSTACFYRRETVIDEGHFLNVNFKVVMDGEYYARLGRAGLKFTRLPLPLAEFRLHGGNLSMKNTSANDIDSLLRYQRQLAESVAIRRAYGTTLFHHPIADSVPDAALWCYYRFKKLALKLFLRKS